MLPTSDQGLGILLAGVGLGVLLWLAGKGGFHVLSFFGFNFQRFRKKSAQEIADEATARQDAASGERRQLADAFLRYSEAAVGIVPMVEASGPANQSLGAWFDVVASALAAALVIFPEDHFRVGIWADLGDPAAFRILGSANLNRNDPKIQQLSKADTIGGHAWRSKQGEYLCVDIKKDRKYKARSSAPRPYTSIFAIRVGEQGRPWGVVTIDAPRPDCFGQQGLVIIRRFAKLISAGAAVAIVRYSPAPGSMVLPRVAQGPARIVASSAAGAGDHEESVDGGSERSSEGTSERRDSDDPAREGGDQPSRI